MTSRAHEEGKGKMTVEEAAAKRNELSYLVSTDVWLDRELVGQSTKGGYVRVTYLKTKPGTTSAEWAAMSSATWKPLAEAWVKENPAMGWGSSTLAMPGGTGLAYNAMTLDFFPTWDAIGKGVPSRALWNKVHPDSDMTAYFDRLALIADRPRIDILKLVEVIVK